MLSTLLILVFLSTFSLAQHEGMDNSTAKAPMRFLWPTQRQGYDEATDDQAPCGGRPVGSRTDFPLTGGALAFVQRDDTFDAQVRISYKASFLLSLSLLMQDPGVNDFEDILPEDEDVDVGHTCYGGFKIKDGTASGSVATFQIEYISGDANETFYICADVNFVDSSSFKTRIPCFNATTEETNEEANGTTTAVGSTSTATSGGNGKFGFGFSMLSVIVVATFGAALVF